ncbi:right-handed parallel beta-helix repeat-containing protein [Kribbella sandramycini]|uniref:Parallel beta-helix repeat protein n=1 Tax=Kribbella sandramycini TaxID=60450 RepID=A0A841SK34_9ACTN|nr:parallel beta-helix repeat protein [Kribbella sandramycini]
MIATENNATTAAKSRPASEPVQAGKKPPTQRATTPAPGKPAATSRPPSAKPSQKPKPSTPVTPSTPPVTTAAPTIPVVDQAAAGPAVAGPCKGKVIEPGDDAADVIADGAAGTTYCFAAGLHRIGTTIRPKAGQVLASSARAVLTGSVPLTGFTRDGDRWVVRGVLPAAYGKSGQCEDNVANICHLREQVFLDGAHLTRVASAGAVAPGNFYADYAANAVYIGSNPAGRSVEMSKTKTAIESGATGVVVRGLTVEHFASAPQSGALVSGPGWQVTANDVRWNHAVGVMLVKANKARIEKNLIHHNGQLGLGQYSSAAATVTRNVISENNTDGFWVADWESGGIKSTRSSGTVSGNLIKANRGVGIWADVADDGRVISGNTISGNLADGIRFEISRNGVISGNVITGNGHGTGRGSGKTLWDGGGININTSSNVEVRDNRLTGNVNGIAIQSRTRGAGPWGAYLLRDVTVTGNTVTMTGAQATGTVQNKAAPLPAGEVTFSDNDYLVDALGTKHFANLGAKLSALAWQSAGLDASSTFSLN